MNRAALRSVRALRAHTSSKWACSDRETGTAMPAPGTGVRAPRGSAEARVLLPGKNVQPCVEISAQLVGGRGVGAGARAQHKINGRYVGKQPAAGMLQKAPSQPVAFDRGPPMPRYDHPESGVLAPVGAPGNLQYGSIMPVAPESRLELRPACNPPSPGEPFSRLRPLRAWKEPSPRASYGPSCGAGSALRDPSVSSSARESHAYLYAACCAADTSVASSVSSI